MWARFCERLTELQTFPALKKWFSVPVLNVKYKLGSLLAKKAGCCHRVNVILCWAKRGVTDDDVEWHLHFSTRAVVEKSKTCEAGFDWKWLQSFPELLFRGDCSIETMIVIGSSNFVISQTTFFLWHPFPEKYLFAGLSNLTWKPENIKIWVRLLWGQMKTNECCNGTFKSADVHHSSKRRGERDEGHVVWFS